MTMALQQEADAQATITDFGDVTDYAASAIHRSFDLLARLRGMNEAAKSRVHDLTTEYCALGQASSLPSSIPYNGPQTALPTPENSQKELCPTAAAATAARLPSHIRRDISTNLDTALIGSTNAVEEAKRVRELVERIRDHVRYVKGRLKEKRREMTGEPASPVDTVEPIVTAESTATARSKSKKAPAKIIIPKVPKTPKPKSSKPVAAPSLDVDLANPSGNSPKKLQSQPAVGESALPSIEQIDGSADESALTLEANAVEPTAPSGQSSSVLGVADSNAPTAPRRSARNRKRDTAEPVGLENGDHSMQLIEQDEPKQDTPPPLAIRENTPLESVVEHAPGIVAAPAGPIGEVAGHDVTTTAPPTNFTSPPLSRAGPSPRSQPRSPSSPLSDLPLRAYSESPRKRKRSRSLSPVSEEAVGDEPMPDVVNPAAPTESIDSLPNYRLSPRKSKRLKGLSGAVQSPTRTEPLAENSTLESRSPVTGIVASPLADVSSQLPDFIVPSIVLPPPLDTKLVAPTEAVLSSDPLSPLSTLGSPLPSTFPSRASSPALTVVTSLSTLHEEDIVDLGVTDDVGPDEPSVTTAEPNGGSSAVKMTSFTPVRLRASARLAAIASLRSPPVSTSSAPGVSPERTSPETKVTPSQSDQSTTVVVATPSGPASVTPALRSSARISAREKGKGTVQELSQITASPTAAAVAVKPTAVPSLDARAHLRRRTRRPVPGDILADSGPGSAALSAPATSLPSQRWGTKISVGKRKSAPRAQDETQVNTDSVPEMEPPSSSVKSTPAEPSPDDTDSDEVDENEPRYCSCNQVSWGSMIACENDECDKEWFHLPCVGLTQPPPRRAKWYCPTCRVLLSVDERGNASTG